MNLPKPYRSPAKKADFHVGHRKIVYNNPNNLQDTVMDNKTALFLAFLILAFLLVDYLFLNWGVPLFIGLKFAALIDWMAFWR